MSDPLLEWRLGSVVVKVWKPDYIETCWPDGKTCRALFVNDDHARYHAKQWGYGDDVNRMHLEHELIHTLRAQCHDLMPWSPVLYHVAGGTPMSNEARAQEEDRVVAIQRVTARLGPLVDEYRQAVEHADRVRQLDRYLEQRKAAEP